MDTFTRVKNAMLAAQRYSWEQGFAAQALLEAGETELILSMARAALMNSKADGRIGTLWNETGITDPAANGEVVLRAFEITDNVIFKDAADKMLEYYMVFAPHTEDGVIYHNEKSFDEGFTPFQIWSDSCYMIPPFLAAMGELNEATKQFFGIMNYLRDDETGCMFHKYDVGSQKFARRELWATGTGWTLLGALKLMDEAKRAGDITAYETLLQTGQDALDSMLKFQRDDGLFHNILDKPDTFTDGTSAMMTAAFIYKSLKEKRLGGRDYKQHADRVRKTVAKNIDEFGFIHGVCGAPEFTEQGLSAEAQAAWLIMETWAK